MCRVTIGSPHPATRHSSNFVLTREVKRRGLSSLYSQSSPAFFPKVTAMSSPALDREKSFSQSLMRANRERRGGRNRLRVALVWMEMFASSSAEECLRGKAGLFAMAGNERRRPQVSLWLA